MIRPDRRQPDPPNACGWQVPEQGGTGVAAVGRLSQAEPTSPILHVTATGWRTEVHEGAVTIRPPENEGGQSLQYVACGAREALGPQEMKSWEGERRSVLLPGGAKLTMRAAGDVLASLSLYEGDESHEIDVLSQVVTASWIDAAHAGSRDASEHDGRTASLLTLPLANTSKFPFDPELLLFDYYVQQVATDGVPLAKESRFEPLARQDSATRAYRYATRNPPPVAEVADACDAIVQPRGGLLQPVAGGMLEYTTRGGEWNIKVDLHTITMHADGPHGVVHTTSIYDGPVSHEIGNTTNDLRHSCVNSAVAQQREQQEADGETAHLVVVRSPDSAVGSLFVINAYNQGDVGAAPDFVPVPLGETGEHDLSPNQVNDLYDDTRLGHT